MAPTNRSILGPPNPYDNHLAPAGTAGFGSPAVSATNDQASLDTRAERDALEASSREASRIAATFSGDGAGGVALTNHAPDAFSTRGTEAADGAGAYGDVIAPEGTVVTRDSNIAADGATGIAVG
jgi:hypothetical protein